MRRPLYTILGLAMLAGPGTARASDAVGRQISVYAQDSKPTQVAVSRAISVLAEKEPTPDAVARQFSVLVKAAEKDDAIARTIAVYSGRSASDPRGGSAARVFCANLPSLGSTAPTVTIADPTHDEFLVAATTTRTVNGTAVPNDGSLGRFVYRKNGSDWKAVTGSFTAWSFIGQLTEGDNLFQVRALNSRGGISPLQGYNIRRNAIPEAEIASPACGTMLTSGTSSAPFEVNASDRVGAVVRLEYQVNGGDFMPVAGAGPFSFSVPGLLPGTNTIGIRVVDDLGEASPVLTCEVSRNRLPTVTILTPADDLDVATAVTTVALSGTASDGDGNLTAVEVNVNGAGFEPATGVATWSATAGGLLPGHNSIEVRAVDALGETSSVATRTVGRNTIPTIVVTSPAEGARFANAVGSATISGTISDEVGPVTSLEWSRNGGAATAIAVGATFSFDSALEVGDNLFTIRATDSFGEVASETQLLVRVGVDRWMIQ